jgi:hypothetical protein
MTLKEIGHFMLECENYRTVELSESNREIILTALELYRTTVTEKLCDDPTEYHDIELLEIDEIIETIGSVE